MHESKVFSVARAWYALCADLQQQSRALLVGAGAVAAVILVLNVVSSVAEFETEDRLQVGMTHALAAAQDEGTLSMAWGGNSWGRGFHAAFFPLVLAVGGFLFTSTLFADLHDKPRAHAYLTLPISTLERWAVRFLISTVGYAVAALVGYFLVTLLGAGVSQLIWGRSHGIFAPSADVWRTVLAYLVTSSLFLFGAVYFRRWHAFKVILAVAGLWFALLLLAAGLAWLLLAEFPGHVDLDTLVPPRIAETIVLGAKIVFWAVMGPLFWFLTYRRLSEAEV